MAACDHNIIWFFNGQPQLHLEGETCLKVDSPHIVQIDYSTYGIKLLNGCIININRDCELYEIEPSTTSSTVFSIPELAQYTRKKKGKYVNEVDKEVVFLTPYQNDNYAYYEEKPNYKLKHKIAHFFCPVYRKKKYERQAYYYYDNNTFILYENTRYYNAIFIYDFAHNYSIAGLGGLGHENNPYLHFMSRGYGEAFEMAMSFECYNWLIDEILCEYIYEIAEYELRTNKPLNVIKKIPYGFSLSSSIIPEEDTDEIDNYDISIYAQSWANKFYRVCKFSNQWNKHYNIVPMINNTCMVNSISMEKYNEGEYDIDIEYVEKLPKSARLILEDEERQYYLDELNFLPLKPSEKFVYTPKQFIKKWNKYIEDRNNQE